MLETAEKIGDEYLNLYQVHSATFESGILTDTAVHEALHRCRQERGWALGLSVSGPRQSEVIREAMKIFVDGERLFDSVQCTFNVLEQAAGEALTEARDAGMDVVVKEGLANGRAMLHPALVAACEAGGGARRGQAGPTSAGCSGGAAIPASCLVGRGPGRASGVKFRSNGRCETAGKESFGAEEFDGGMQVGQL